MKAAEKDQQLAGRIAEAINPGSLANGWHPMGQKLKEHARTLRRAQMTLHRWAEEMCNGTIQRDGEQGDGKPFRYYDRMWNDTPQKELRHYIPDRERGALRRVEQVCKDAGLFYFHQRDPRGCALYVSNQPLNDTNYSKGIACL